MSTEERVSDAEIERSAKEVLAGQGGDVNDQRAVAQVSSAIRNAITLPQVAVRYHCCEAEVRGASIMLYCMRLTRLDQRYCQRHRGLEKESKRCS